MTNAAIIEERVTIPNGPLQLEGVLTYPEAAAPVRALLVCPPHPNFAGDFENNVVRAFAQELGTNAVTLRFNYHGVGDSTIRLPAGMSVFDYWQRVEESGDYSPAVADVQAAAAELGRLSGGLPMTILGYSFGAVTALQCDAVQAEITRFAGISPPISRVKIEFSDRNTRTILLVSGDDDFVCPAADLRALAGRAGGAVTCRILPGCDHFYRGMEVRLVECVRPFLEGSESDLS